MDNIYAICNRCGTPLAMPIVVSGDSNVRINMIGSNKIHCPCGGLGVVPDARYDLTSDGVIKVIAASDRSKAELERIAEILSGARDRNASLDELTALVKKEIPELVSLSDMLPTSRGELYAFISIVLAAIAIIIGQIPKSTEPPITINQTINLQTASDQQSTESDSRKLDSLRRRIKKGKRRK